MSEADPVPWLVKEQAAALIICELAEVHVRLCLSLTSPKQAAGCRLQGMWSPQMPAERAQLPCGPCTGLDGPAFWACCPGLCGHAHFFYGMLWQLPNKIAQASAVHVSSYICRPSQNTLSCQCAWPHLSIYGPARPAGLPQPPLVHGDFKHLQAAPGIRLPVDLHCMMCSRFRIQHLTAARRQSHVRGADWGIRDNSWTGASSMSGSKPW